MKLVRSQVGGKHDDTAQICVGSRENGSGGAVGSGDHRPWVGLGMLHQPLGRNPQVLIKASMNGKLMGLSPHSPAEFSSCTSHINPIYLLQPRAAVMKLGSELFFPTQEVQLLPGTSGGHYNKEKYSYWKRF